MNVVRNTYVAYCVGVSNRMGGMWGVWRTIFSWMTGIKRVVGMFKGDRDVGKLVTKSKCIVIWSQ